MVHETHAKTILYRTKSPSSWFHTHYNMNIYRGCQHGCIYCDSRSDCYHVSNFDEDITVKINTLEMLEKALHRFSNQYTVGTGAMCDPYMPIEKQYNLTGQALDLLAQYRFPVHITTKSNLILKDINQLVQINEAKMATVAFTVTTADDDLAKIVEPNAPSPSERFQAMGILSELGIQTGVTLMPLLPFIEDTEENINTIIEKAIQSHASFVVPIFGVTLRDSQREYYYQKLDRHFPGLKEKYIQQFKNSYYCHPKNSKLLYDFCIRRCAQNNIITHMKQVKHYTPSSAQLSLFDDMKI